MATASTISDTMPTPCDGKNLWNGKRNPVTLVSTVVTKNSGVQPSSRLPPSSPNTTTNPDKIPIKLSTTCTKVNVVIPKIMRLPLPVGKVWMIVPNEKILLIASRRNFRLHLLRTPGSMNSWCEGPEPQVYNC